MVGVLASEESEGTVGCCRPILCHIAYLKGLSNTVRKTFYPRFKDEETESQGGHKAYSNH